MAAAPPPTPRLAGAGKPASGGRLSRFGLVRDLAVARRALERAPEIARPDLARLAREVRSGSYRVPADLVAERILEYALMSERMS